MGTIVCIHCNQRRPTGEDDCPHCGKPPMQHKQTAAEFQERLKEIAALDPYADRSS